MRRLLILVCGLVWVDTLLYSALTPLLPHFEDTLDLSKAGVGVLVAAYAAGALVGGLPGGIAAARLGPRRAVLVGLALMGLASLGFAFAQGFWPLVSARFLQGVGSGFTWAGAFAWLLAATPGKRRGEVIGTAMGAAVFGALLGPVVGAAAGLVGRDVVFTALAALAIVFAAWTLRLDESVPLDAPSLAAVRRALRDNLFLGGLVLMALPSFLFGVLSTLAPLHLSAAGWGTTAIAAVWVVGACVETVISPVAGRVLDRRGVLFPVQLALTAAVPVTIGLAFGPRPLAYVPLIVLAGGAYGALFTPAFALIAEGAERTGLAQGMAFGLMNAAWALGALIGPVAGGAVAEVSGDVFPYLVSAAFCGSALVAVRRAQHRTAARAVRSDLAG